jgi:predicted DNA-binding transcriptional regulator AlpA
VDHKPILNTWKEIAQYVGRSARTIQRWERDLGFPVHRPHGRSRSAILAIPAEIDAWVKNTPHSTIIGNRVLRSKPPHMRH